MYGAATLSTGFVSPCAVRGALKAAEEIAMSPNPRMVAPEVADKKRGQEHF